MAMSADSTSAQNFNNASLALRTESMDVTLAVVIGYWSQTTNDK